SLPPRSPPPLAVALPATDPNVGRWTVPDAFFSASGAVHWSASKPRTVPNPGHTAVRAASVRTEATLTHDVRRRPTLPRGPPPSTIGAEGLNFRVRNGTGCFPFAMTAETLWRFRSSAFLGRTGLRVTRPTVPREPHSGRDPFGGPGVAPRASTAP